MAQSFSSNTGKTLTHIYVRDAQTGFVRPCWATSTDVYCGICLKGTLQPAVGKICPVCSSAVERILQTSPSAAQKPASMREHCSSREVPHSSEGGLNNGTQRPLPDLTEQAVGS